jgi:3-oxoacyl-[acyl-carrier protein] reductase
MTRHLAAELSMFSIRVNCTAPSQTHSKMLDSALSAEQQVILASKNPMNRLAYASEQADVIYYLCCRESSYINGAVIDVNGGVL